MMKNLLALVSAALLSFSVHAAKFTEGDYYKVLDQPQSSTPIVTEFFSIYCPHCFQFEPMIQQLKTKLPDNAKLQKMHVSFMGGPMGKVMSKAFATAVVLNVNDKMLNCYLTAFTRSTNHHVMKLKYVKSSLMKVFPRQSLMALSIALPLTQWSVVLIRPLMMQA